jgi:SAM-dependent methyltransferase
MNAVIWHDLECGNYVQDLALWLELAATQGSGSPVLDVGAGTGRVALRLARAGHQVVALDLDAELLRELDLRAGGLPIQTVVADARDFELPGRSFALCVVPMQTIQLFGGSDGRAAFLRRAAVHLRPGGVLAIAIAQDLEEFEWHNGDDEPVPDVVERDGAVYFSQPTAVRRCGRSYVLERVRETVYPSGRRDRHEDRVALDNLSAGRLLKEGVRVGLRALETRHILPTVEHVGSEVVIFSV